MMRGRGFASEGESEKLPLEARGSLLSCYSCDRGNRYPTIQETRYIVRGMVTKRMPTKSMMAPVFIIFVMGI